MRLVGAGDRVYLYGLRKVGGALPPLPIVGGLTAPAAAGGDDAVPRAPFILFNERGSGGWTDGSADGESGGGYDPAWQNPSPGIAGRIDSLAVAENPDGSHSGWAVGAFYDSELPMVGREPSHLLMRLETDASGEEAWTRVRDTAINDYMQQEAAPSGGWRSSEPHLQAMLPQRDGHALGLMAQNNSGRLFGLDPAVTRWSTVNGGRPPASNPELEKEHIVGHYQAIAPDNQGGAWVALKNMTEGSPGLKNQFSDGGQVFFYHYTARPPEPVFEDTPNPFGDKNVRLTSLSGAPNGTVWAATDAALLARYDRATGWQSVRIPGWDPGRVVTAGSPVNAVALGPNGEGVAVGKAGRIAQLSTESVRLDEAASVLCEGTGLGPGCGTSRDLRAAAVAPGGSALVAGDSMAALWRPSPTPEDPEPPFQRIPDPPGGLNANATSISLPTPDRAWITTSTGLVIAGQMQSAGDWSWRVENKIASGPAKGMALGALNLDQNLPLRGVAIDASGHGYAVGDRGLLLERTANPAQPWRRLRGPGTDDLTSVTLAQGEGESQAALVGGRHGVVWSVSGSQARVARPADFFPFEPQGEETPTARSLTGPVIGMALLPGVAEGQTEAWVAIAERGEGTSRLLHYSSNPDEPLLDATGDAAALPDTPAERPGELRFAALGKSDCQRGGFCEPMAGTSDSAELALGRIVDELGAEAPDFSLFTGDAAYSTGFAGTSVTPLDRTGDPSGRAASAFDAGLVSRGPRAFGARHHHRFAENAVLPLAEEGIPTLGTAGPGDLSRVYSGVLTSGTMEQTKTGDNLAWREGLESVPGPWGAEGDEATSRSGLTFEPASGSDDNAQPFPDQTVDADLDEDRDPLVQPTEVKGGAKTHYASDVLRDGEEIARVVVVDSSLRQLAAADAVQNPIELDGQLAWLERMLCFKGQTPSGGGECTREPDQEAIVLSNTPTYTYSTGLDPSSTATDAGVLESLYLRYRVSVVVSGRLGWNGLYYALRPGLHTPCPGDAYPERPPDPSLGLCESVAARLPVGDPTGQATAAAETAERASGASVAEITSSAGGLTDAAGIVPFVVASGAGGKFGPLGEAADQPASEGFWHGYTLVRLAPDGDPRKMVVEQRPILDWVSIEANDHVANARERIRLRGLGREPIAYSQGTGTNATRYDEISTAAITHRFDLTLADPEEPWVPCSETDPACLKLQAGLEKGPADAPASSGADAESPTLASDTSADDNPCAPYLCLPGRVGTIDRLSGEVRAGDGRYPDTYAVAILSVKDQVATYPLVFAKSPSFVTRTTLRSVGAPPIDKVPTPRPPGTPPIPDVPTIPKIEVPAIPPPPAIPSLTAAAPPELQPPAPPAPPPPSQQPTPLDLSVAPPGVSISTPTALIQPPTPPVNPAPPGGARREARQRQAAAQKGGADSSEGAEETQDAGGDMADGRSGAHGSQSMTRLEATRRDARVQRSALPAVRPEHPAPSFTTLASTDQPSAWARGALYGGGIGFAALVLAFSWVTLRPGTRRGEPELPAPARSVTRSYRG